MTAADFSSASPPPQQQPPQQQQGAPDAPVVSPPEAAPSSVPKGASLWDLARVAVAMEAASPSAVPSSSSSSSPPPPPPALKKRKSSLMRVLPRALLVSTSDHTDSNSSSNSSGNESDSNDDDDTDDDDEQEDKIDSHDESEEEEEETVVAVPLLLPPQPTRGPRGGRPKQKVIKPNRDNSGLYGVGPGYRARPTGIVFDDEELLRQRDIVDRKIADYHRLVASKTLKKDRDGNALEYHVMDKQMKIPIPGTTYFLPHDLTEEQVYSVLQFPFWTPTMDSKILRLAPVALPSILVACSGPSRNTMLRSLLNCVPLMSFLVAAMAPRAIPAIALCAPLFTSPNHIIRNMRDRSNNFMPNTC
jgi:hypothetical protein